MTADYELDGKMQTIVRDTADPDYKFTSLRPGVIYSILVLSVGGEDLISEKSEAVSTMTSSFFCLQFSFHPLPKFHVFNNVIFLAVPEPPTDLEIDSVSEKSVALSWKPAMGELLSYGSY